MPVFNLSTLMVGMLPVLGAYVGGQSVYGGGAVQPMMAIGVVNQIENGMTTRATLAHCSYTPIDIGSSDAASLTLSFKNWYILGSSVINNANTVDIVACSVQYNGVSVPAYFSGSRSITLAVDANDIQAATLYPSDFGVTSFPRGARLWVKMKASVANTTHTFPTSLKLTSGGLQSYYYTPAATTMSDVDALGQFAYTGTAPQSRQNVMSPWALGTFVSGDPIVRLHHGDSISQSLYDTGTNLYGDGWFQRSLSQADYSLPEAGMNFSVSGTQMVAAYIDARIMAYYKYANRGSFMYGANDFGTSGTGTPLAVMQGRVNTVCANMKTAPSRITKIIGGYVLPRATSTDLWVTEANQTVSSAEWDVGGITDQYNSWLASKVGTTLDAVHVFQAVRGISFYKWKTTGAANAVCFDFVHPNAGGHPLMAENARSVYSSIT